MQHGSSTESTNILSQNETLIEIMDPFENDNENQEVQHSLNENITSGEISPNPILSSLISHNPAIVHQLNFSSDYSADLVYNNDECEVVMLEKCFTQQTQQCVKTYVKENQIVIVLFSFILSLNAK